MINPYFGYTLYPMLMPFIPQNCDKPPTLYSILETICNPETLNLENQTETKIKIKNLAKTGRTYIFDFDYPLTDKVNKEEFETNILNHFLMRRIGFETVTAFKIMLNSKLNEIMPLYNKMLNLIYTDGWGTITEKNGSNDRNIENTNNSNTNTSNTLNNNSETNNESDNRYSDTPQDQINNIKNGNYITEYTFNQNTSSDTSNSNGTSASTSKSNDTTKDNNTYHEITSTANLFDELKKLNEDIKSVYSLIYKELDTLFYQII